jgi:hypothetical protein
LREGLTIFAWVDLEFDFFLLLPPKHLGFTGVSHHTPPRNLFLTILEAWKSKIKVSTDVVSGED